MNSNLNKNNKDSRTASQGHEQMGNVGDKKQQQHAKGQTQSTSHDMPGHAHLESGARQQQHAQKQSSQKGCTDNSKSGCQ